MHDLKSTEISIQDCRLDPNYSGPGQLLTEENCITAICIFEALTQAEHPEMENLIAENGVFWLRQQCAELSKQVDQLWLVAVKLAGGVEFPIAFDWEFLPEVVDHHLDFTDTTLRLKGSKHDIASAIVLKLDQQSIATTGSV